MIKVIFFGTPEFAEQSLAELEKNSNIKIEAVITQPDKPAGRKNKLTAPPIKALAEKLNIKVHQPKDKNELLQVLKLYKSDFFVVIAYGMILPNEILKMPKYSSINVHASLLPKYRGASPIQEALLNGDEETGISIMAMDEKLDHGKVFIIKRIEINSNDNFETLSQKMSKQSAEILPHILQDIADNILKPIAQDEAHIKPSYCRKIKKNDGRINWNKKAKDILNMIRAYTPWPSAYTTINNKKLKIIEADISSEQIEPGNIVIEQKIMKIGTSEGSLIPKKVQLEGKNTIKIEDFINGQKHNLPEKFFT